MFKIRKKNTIVNKKIVGNREKIMKIYKRKKGCTIILWLLIAAFIYVRCARGIFRFLFYVRLCRNCGGKLCLRLFGADCNGNYKK